MSFIRLLHGVTYMLPATVVAWFVMVFLVPPLSLLLVFKQTRSLFHRIYHAIFYIWLALACASLEYLANTRLEIFVDEGTKLLDENAIIISNHPTHLDWHPIFCLFARFGRPDWMYIFLKQELRKIPIYGWAWQTLMYVFLQRHNRDADMSWISRSVSDWAKSGLPGSWLIFPEGTDMAKRNVERSRQFAEERGLQMFNHIIQPRTTGFVALLKEARAQMKSVYDLTVAFQYYSKDERPTESSYIKGRFPPTVHMYVQRIPIEELPTEDDALADWCKERFKMKEDLLDKAYQSIENKHLSLHMPGTPIDPSFERAAKLYYFYSSCFCLFVTYWLAQLLLTPLGLAYAVVITVVLQVLSLTVGIDTVLLDIGY